MDYSYEIPPNLPFPKEGIYPSLAKRGEGRFFRINFFTTSALFKCIFQLK
jgi:hypothetical protein